jgi:acetyl esterase/lipase
MPGPDTILIVLLAGAVVAGFVQGLSGFAFGLTATSIWVWWLPPQLVAVMSVFGALAALSPEARLVLSGDSAGGGLALALMMAMRDEGGPLPERCFVISPWTDLTASGPSVETNRRRDWFSRRHGEAWIPRIVAGADRADPRISPLFGRFEDLPPLLFVVGGHEVILDDTRRCVAKARAAGVMADELIGERMLHDYPLALPKLAESQRAWRAIAGFCRAPDRRG